HKLKPQRPEGRLYIASLDYSCSLFIFAMRLCANISRAQTVPALYVFGDSLVDVENNNYLPLTIVKANFPHNGIDFPSEEATERFSNGKNAADIIAGKLGLPTPLPYLSQTDNVFLKGASFASGGAGVFNTTDEGLIKHTIPMAHQVEHFSTVCQRLENELRSRAAVQKHLAKPLFLLVIGSNDIINHFKLGLYASSEDYTPQQYVTLMVSTLKQQLKGIYDIGGRKFLVFGIAPIGCAPRFRFEDVSNECNEQVNYWAKKYNEKLTQMLALLHLEVNEFCYLYFDAYGIFLDFIQRPESYGFIETKAACCGLGRLRAKLPCTPLALVCSNRNATFFGMCTILQRQPLSYSLKSFSVVPKIMYSP
ncbi:GDSL esterase/lipase, partial [Striga asiatica]